MIAVPRERGEMAQRPGVEVTPTGWLSEADLGMRDWAEHGRRLGVIGRGVGWWIGDWLRYGNERFGERYVRASRITGYDVQTLTNMVYVATAYGPEERREGLSWSHHAELAARDPEERKRWLDMAESERLSVRCLRDEVRRARRVEERAELAAGAEPALELEQKQEREQEREPQAQPARRTDRGHRVVCPECGCHVSRARGEAGAPAA